MIAYKQIADEITDVLSLLENNNVQEAKLKLVDLHMKIKERTKNTSSKTLDTRNNSNRARRLHNVDNKLSYARKKNNLELIQKLVKEKEYILENILD